MLISAMIPVVLWKMSPEWWHPYLIALAVLLLLGALILLIRYIVRDRLAIAAMPSRSEHRWPDGWDVQRFCRSLLTHLKVNDWRILAAEAGGPDRLLLRLKRDRHHLTLLCVRPGRGPSAEDLDYLEDMRRRQGTLESALISDPPARSERQPAVVPAVPVMLRYDALEDLFGQLDRNLGTSRGETASLEIQAALPPPSSDPAQPPSADEEAKQGQVEQSPELGSSVS